MKKLVLFTVCLLAYSSAFAKAAEKKAFTLENTSCSLRIKSETTRETTDIKFVMADSHMIGKFQGAQYKDKDILYSSMLLGGTLQKDPSTMVLGGEISGTNMKTGDTTLLRGTLVMTEEQRHGIMHFNSVSADGKEFALAITCEVAK